MSYNNYDSGYNTSYGAGGGGGGGGFVPDGSQNSPGGGRKDYSQDSLRPVTIKQILDAQPVGNGFNIDGSPITQLTFVGQIRNISSQATNITYKLDDGTGSIEVKKWVDSDAIEQDSTKTKLTEGSYCRAWGKLNSFNDRKHVGAQIIRPVEDLNEVSYHLLEATVVHLHFTRGPPSGAAATTGGNVPQQQQQQQAAGAGFVAADLAGYSSAAKRVFQHMRQAEQTNEGLHQQDIAAKLGMDPAEVARAGDDLLSGGLIYTTVDDLTWAVLEGE
ncbi:replication protein-like protein A 32 kDa subunit [Melanomma pulvis-pyrius CBS 109.77]|uniref:Replication protein-like protein A 32 kDa subunit n=1 Tax=Melanomma pulvis-pyrius CBS 109.77 TaxID=1314802 RepID=A0A6A6X652_9PLEO|nr:replication protein-like protein A 32 kDa subunit [Melanomma pulvis-pyrius CBS 109.77]